MNEVRDRPDPDALLRRVSAEEAREKRAKLKIFFGFAPGVGKTYAMLESAQRLRAQGVDVVIGCVETHGRKETEERVAGLPVLPRRIVEHRGTRLEELDLEAALARKPALLLIDELAHTNAPGSTHLKRYQDVVDLLEAGIDVHTTMNVQHVEGLNDVVAQITQVRVRETVPDAIFDRADEIELVDVPPEELLQRLRAGKVYLGDQAARAAQHFFQHGNLLALRELALRRTADRVDAEMQAYREAHDIAQTWAAGERILVCISPSPASARLLRATRRMAAGLRAPWVAAYVEPSIAPPLTAADRERLDAHLYMAEQLGAEVVRLTGASTSEALLDYARTRNVTRILIGKPTHPRLRDRLRGSLLDEIVRGSGEIDVLVMSGDVGTVPTVGPREPERQSVRPAHWVWACAFVVLATVAAALARALLAAPDVVMLYLVMIMVVAVRQGRGPAILASALSVAAYDFFFVPPLFTFAVSDTHHVLTFAMMFGVGLVMSALTLRIRRQEQSALEREARTAALYAQSRDLATALDDAQSADILARHALRACEGGVAVHIQSRDGDLEKKAEQGTSPADSAEQGVARWALEHARPAGLGTDTIPGARHVCLPILMSGKAIGVLAVAPRSGKALSFDQRGFLEALARQAALSFERSRLAEAAKAASVRARTEEMRASLLSAVSHDLRTPLAAITGAATSLRDDGSKISVVQHDELVITICEEAERLERLVRNLLDMTRLDSGAMSVKREWVPLDDMVSGALTRLDHVLGEREVTTDWPADLPLLFVDPLLIEQVLLNLLENAAKYTPATSPLEVFACVQAKDLVIEIRDRGPGLSPSDLERIFEKFYRGSHVGISGVGLGLPICRGIADAHGGSLVAENRTGGGSVFRLTLPLLGAPPSMVDDEASPAPQPTGTV